jgi:hypothetical protein
MPLSMPRLLQQNLGQPRNGRRPPLNSGVALHCGILGSYPTVIEGVSFLSRSTTFCRSIRQTKNPERTKQITAVIPRTILAVVFST